MVVNLLVGWCVLLPSWAGGLGRFFFLPCGLGSHMSRLRHLGWNQCSHGLSSRPAESCHHQCLKVVRPRVREVHRYVRLTILGEVRHLLPERKLAMGENWCSSFSSWTGSSSELTTPSAPGVDELECAASSDLERAPTFALFFDPGKSAKNPFISVSKRN